MKIFTSDLHHEHKKIVEFTNRKLVTTQEEHTDWLRDTWNRQVQNSDLVFHLGDFSFSKDYNAILEFVKSLKGQKIFIKGNHCDSKILTRLVQDNAIAKWCHYDSTKIAGQHVCLFHFPIACWDRQGYGSWHLHGHSHGGYRTEGKILDVGIDNAYNVFGEHKFFTEEDITEYMQQRAKVVKDEHADRTN